MAIFHDQVYESVRNEITCNKLTGLSFPADTVKSPVKFSDNDFIY